MQGGAEEAKNVHVLSVKLKPAKAGEVNRVIHLLTDLPGDNRTDFRVTAKVTEAK